MKKFGLAVTLFFGLVFVAHAGCDVKSLVGNYATQATYTGFKGGYATTCGDMGILTFDGKGNATGIGFESCAGNTYTIPKTTGFYSIDALCTGGVVFGKMTIKFVLDKTLKTGMILGGNPDNLSSGVGTMFKQ